MRETRKPTRWLEVKDDGERIIHADGAEQDYTLCGYAYEGEAHGEVGDGELIEVSRGKINCPTCVATIRYAKSIPARFVAEGSDQ